MSDPDKWTMRGLDERSPLCLKTAREVKEYILSIGLLPLFRNEISGFSVEEHVPSGHWWTDDEERDPWCWRMKLAEDKDLAYGKFFDGKAGFVSRECFPYFAALRRDGYDFDARADEGLAKPADKRIIACFEKRNFCDTAYLKENTLLKGQFEPTVVRLMAQTYLIVSGFVQRVNKMGQPYGWHMSQYTTPEVKWGYAYVTGAYNCGADEARTYLLSKLSRNFSNGDFQHTLKL